MEINLPQLSLVILLGPSSPGKRTFAEKHFHKDDILSQELFLEMVAGPNRSPHTLADAQAALEFVLEKRLRNGLFTVVDGSHFSKASRKLLCQTSKKSHIPVFGIWLDSPGEDLHQRFENSNALSSRMSRVRQQTEEPDQYTTELKAEGFSNVYHLASEQEIDDTSINLEPLPCNHREVNGPFDLIGDVHGCLDELILLLTRLGYKIIPGTVGEYTYKVIPPKGRRAVFVGDLVHRGPDSLGVLKLTMDMVRSGIAFCVTGNHDDKLKRYLLGQEIKTDHGLANTISQMNKEDEAFHSKVKHFLQGLPDHLVLDGGSVTVAHAGLKEAMQGRQSSEVRSFCLYGDITGEKDELGLPVRYDWAREYKGESIVVYGHIPVPEAIWRNNTINIDTGCVYGGSLTALRLPEKEIVSVPAAKVYSEPRVPLVMNLPDSQQDKSREFIDFDRITAGNLVSTRNKYSVTIREQALPPVLEFLELGGLDPKWLIYLPPRLSPADPSTLPGYLEHLTEALNYYTEKGTDKVLVEEMHGGEEVTIVLAKDEASAIKRFNIREKRIGTVINSKGQPYFDARPIEQDFLESFRKVLDHLKLWEVFHTDWFCITGEMTPGAKNWKELATNYHRLNSAAKISLTASSDALLAATQAGLDVQSLLVSNSVYQDYHERFARVLAMYDLPFARLEDYCFYPSCLLASEGKTYFDKEQIWHREIWGNLASPRNAIQELCGDLFKAPSYQWVTLNSIEEKQKAIAWFELLSERGSAGVIARPASLVMEAEGELVQPGLTVRGREFLRLIYGMDYDRPDLLERHRMRKLEDIRHLTVRQLALGIEALSRFVEKQSLTDVYVCIFALLALQTEDIDPRL